MTIPVRSDIRAEDLREAASKTADATAARRMEAVARVIEGASRAEAARHAGIRRGVFAEWIKRLNAHGIAALHDKPRGSYTPRRGTIAEEHPGLAAYFIADPRGRPLTQIGIQAKVVATWRCWMCADRGQETLFNRRVAEMVSQWQRGGGVCQACKPELTARSHRETAVARTGSLADLHPDVAREYAPDNPIPSDRIPAGSKTSVDWICTRCGHRWTAQVATRTRMGCGCDRCTRKSSRLELRLYAEFLHDFPDAQHRYTAGRTLPEVDVYLPDLRIGIELDGGFYHDNRLSKEKAKTRTLREAGVELVRLRHSDLEPLPRSCMADVDRDQVNVMRKFCTWLVDHVPALEDFARARLTGPIFHNDAEYARLLGLSPNARGGSSLVDTHPWITDVWSPENALGPTAFTAGSHYTVRWLCPRDPEHAYDQPIAQRVSYGPDSCPYCSGVRLSRARALAAVKPTIAQQWDAAANGCTAEQIHANSMRPAWWRCAAGHAWQAPPAERKEDRPGFAACPTCWQQERSLAGTQPELLQDWDWPENAARGITPWEIARQSNQEVSWCCCKCGHRWRAVVASRVRQRTRCPNPACRHSHYSSAPARAGPETPRRAARPRDPADDP